MVDVTFDHNADQYKGYDPYPYKEPVAIGDINFHNPFDTLDPELPDFTNLQDCIPDLPSVSFNIQLPSLPVLPQLAIPGMDISLLNIPMIPLPSLPAIPNFEFNLTLPDLPDLSLWDAGDINITPLTWPGFSNIPDCMSKE